MARRRLSPEEVERRLAEVRRRYEAAKARIAEVGFVCEGSLVERYTSCHNPNCHCADPERRHGPYWQLSWKEDGRTVSRLLSEDAAALYREWVANRRHLASVLVEMRSLSREAGQYLADEAGVSYEGPKRPRSPRTR
jgi:hypothetical protein